MPAIKKFLPLIIAAISGLVAVVLINSYISQRTQEAQARLLQKQESSSTVVVAREDIPVNTPLREDMLAEARVNRNMLQPGAVNSIGRVIGRVTLAPLSRGEQVLLNKIALSDQEGGTLSTRVPTGKRAITIPVDNISSVGGMIRPGDHVDIVGMVPIPAMGADGKQVVQMTSMPLFQDILVLAVGQDYGGASSGGKKGGAVISSLITFALPPEQANLVAFVQEQGRIRLVLRSPGDTQVQQVAPASWDTVFRTVMPQAFQQPEKQEVVKPLQKKVEIFRGLQKETKVLE
ncbi:MAG: Flp pilus assembly protein CpaB [Candidatus Omnitrophota bacterium]|nr:Flp pilus assembly protein CpaB [Candidatus Omnitrophota bacterium]